MASLVYLSLLSMLLSVESCASPPIIETSIGAIQGKEESEVFQFLGIPFAEPPTGERRFTKPVKKERMLMTYNASYFRPSCPQMVLPFMDQTMVLDEDCLYLNIYTPLNSSQEPSKVVMVWIHGGSYLFGSGRDFEGTALASQQDVILVNINYRLGALGFLNTKEENAGGNLGLWDQTMALEWIQRNIAAFGGDPGRVTIFGQSSGSACVTQLSISPFTEGLFQRVIAESGTASAAWTGYNNPVESARRLGRLFGCPTMTNHLLIQCLRQIPAQDIADSQHRVPPDNAFVPTYGTDFLPYTMEELATNQSHSKLAKRFAELDFIVGQNSNEGAMFLYFFVSSILKVNETVDFSQGISEDVYNRTLFKRLTNMFPDDLNMAQKAITPIKFMYRDWESEYDGISRVKSVINFFSDIIFTPSVVAFARSRETLQERTSPGKTYMYLFDHRGSWMTKETWRSGADHADEIPFVFGFPFLKPNLNASQAEKDLSANMMRYWINFAKTGSPNNRGTNNWPVFEEGTEQYLKMNADQMSIGNHLYNQRVAFWLDFFPEQIQLFRKEPVSVPCGN